MDWGSGVAMELAILSCGPNGRLWHDRFTQAAMRAAIFIDLQTDGRLAGDPDPWIDTNPVGFRPIDNLLAVINRKRAHNANWWIGNGPDVQQDLTDAWVRAGLWSRDGRSVTWCDAAVEARAADRRAELDAIRDRGVFASEHDASIAALAQASWLLDNSTRAGPDPDVPDPELLNACRGSRWIVELAVVAIVKGRRAMSFHGSATPGA